MQRRVLILKDPDTKISVGKNHLNINKRGAYLIISFNNIKEIFLNKSIKICIEDCYKIFQKVPLYFIDSNGYILFSLKEEVENG